MDRGQYVPDSELWYYADEEMDSADEETELASAVQNLIRRLGEKTSSYWIRPRILSGQDVEYFFPIPRCYDGRCYYASRDFLLYAHSVRLPSKGWLSKNTGWRSQVRLRMLEAIGSSISSSKFLFVGDICSDDEMKLTGKITTGNISRLTASEWEVLLRGFRSSSVLEEMRICNLDWSSEADLESLGLQLGIILNTSSVAKLEIHDQIESMCNRTQRSRYLYQSGLTERFFLNLASGLRENSHSKLTSLVLHDAWGNAVKFIIEVLTGHHQLETLILDITWGGDEATVRLLSQALKQNSSLKQLALDQVKDGCAALLLNALAGDDGNRSIEQLELIRMSGIGKCLAEVFISNRSLRVVKLDWIFMDVEEWRLLGEAIRDNATATTVFIGNNENNELGLKEVEEFSCAASSEGKEPMLHLDNDVHTLSDLKFVGRVLRGEIKSVKSLSLRLDFTLSHGTSIEDILPSNRITGETSRLKRLHLRPGTSGTIGRGDSGIGLWKHLVQCLRWNTSVTSLSFSFQPKKEFKDGGLEEECKDGEFEEEFKDLMTLLQVNLTLREIDVSETPWARDGKAALIEAALKQNQERAVYMSVFTAANLQLGDAKAGRLFLCGSPRAGKTQLRRTLMKIIQDKSWFGERCEELSRTNGIEVEFLQNNDKMQISIWDLAGQWIFRTLQNVLFPKTNDFCVFLFVYSPFCEEKSSPKPDICFQTELEGWLTFIASSTKVTGHNLPQVLVVISHKDKMESTSLTWANSIVEVVRKRFKNYVDLRPIQDFLYVNAREKNQVIPLKEHIFFIFQELLSRKSPLVPQLCFKVSSLLLSNIKKNKTCSLWSSEKFHDFCFILSSLLFSNIENKTCPLWSLEKFHDFCYPIFEELNLPSSVDHLRLSKSLLSYLNDVGFIIYIPNFDHIVVDPNWLTNSVLGELIAMGQQFKAQESNAYEKTMSSDSYTSKDGFVSESVFTRLIETFLEKQPRLQNVDREVIEKILFNLDLGFKLENSFQYFIPSFIREYAIMEEQKQQEEARVVSMSWESKVANPNFAGIRIQCKDQKTMSLSAAFFPRYQMFMRRKLISKMSVSMDTLTFSRHYLKLFLDGHEIYVEHVQSEESHYYVDVLMLCSEHKSKEAAIKYVLDNIVKELISFCATPNGCPGVALVLGVIQTICVKTLIPIHLRGAILIEELKSKFSNSINDNLEDIALDRSQLVKEEELLNYEHTWSPIPALHLNTTFEPARNLLWERDVEAVVNEIRLKRNQQVESLQQSLISLNNDLAQSHHDSESTVSNSSIPHIKDCNPASASCSSQASTSGDTQLLFKMDKLEENLGGKIDGVHERLRSVESIVQRLDVKLDVKLGQIISLQQQLQSTFSAFMSKVDRIIGYSELHQQSKIPKRPYITDDVGIFYKMSARLHLGEVLRLRLMCESITGFHPVEGQEGLKLRVDLENSGWIPRIIDISYRFLYYGVKAVTLRLGGAIPQWDDLQTNIVRLKSISDIDRRAIHNGGCSVELNEAWLRIQQDLAPLLKDNYSKIFKLYQVKYLGQQNGGHAWICKECMTKGRHSGSLAC